MNIRTLVLALSLCLTVNAGEVNARDIGASETSTIAFDGQEYSYKWSVDDLHEFTPGEQSVVGQWTEMVTVNYYPVVSSSADLGVITSAVLENYKDSGGIVLGVETIPETNSKPAEHIIAVVFGAPEAAEFAMVKFQLHDGIGASVAYAHREYGADVGNVMNNWLDENGTRLQDRITKFNDIPPHADFQATQDASVLSRLGMAI